MRKRWIIGCFVAFVLFIFLIYIVRASTPGNITSCQVLDTAGVYTLTQGVSSEGTCFTINASDITLDCQGFALNYSTGGDTGAYGVNVSGANNVTIKDCNIEKNSTDGGNGYGIYFSDSNYSQIENVNITTNGTSNNYGIYLLNSSNNSIVENHIRTFGSGERNYGIYLWSSRNNTLLSNNITASGLDQRNYGIYLLENSTYNNITGNIIDTNGTLLNVGIYLLKNGSYNHIIYNNITVYGTGTSVVGIYINRESHNNTVLDNNVSTIGSDRNWAIYVRGDKNNLSYNSLASDGPSSGCCYHGGIGVEGSKNYVVANNITTNGKGYGNIGVDILDHSTYSVVESNNINTNGTTIANGVHVETGANHTFIKYNVINTFGSGNSSNPFFRAGSRGIELETDIGFSPINVTILYNNITTNGYYRSNIGIYAFNSTDLNITFNNINTNGSHDSSGILIRNFDGVNIVGNNITTRAPESHGIYLDAVNSTNSSGNNIAVFGKGSYEWFFNNFDDKLSKNSTQEFNLSRHGILVVTRDPMLRIGTLTSSQLDDYGYGNPSGKSSMGIYFNITNATSDTWIDVNITYTDADVVDAGLTESTMEVYKYNGSQWVNTDFYTDRYGIDTENNVVYANITTFSIFGVFGQSSSVASTEVESSTVGSPPSSETSVVESCDAIWVCYDWEECVDGISTRVCDDLAECDSDSEKPIESQECSEGECLPSFSCGGWSDCSFIGDVGDILSGEISTSGSRSRTCVDDNSCISLYIEEEVCSYSFEQIDDGEGVSVPDLIVDIETTPSGGNSVVTRNPITGKPTSRINIGALLEGRLEISFVQDEDKYPNYCFDAVMNEDEVGVDCGGSCDYCLEGVDVKVDLYSLLLLNVMAFLVTLFGLKVFDLSITK